jgi:hypothetical protein
MVRSGVWDRRLSLLSGADMAALFNPPLRRVQESIDRRFYRQKYDAEKALAEFAATARNETDLESLASMLVRVVSETVQPEHVSMWMKPASNRSGEQKQFENHQGV